MNGQIKRGHSRRKASHKIAHFCHKKWKKCCAAALCVTVAASNLTGTFSAEAKSDTYNFELSRESLDEALQEALYDGATVTEEDFIFEGSSADDYVSLMNTDTALYELKPEIKENDEDLVLRVFARVDGDLVTNEDFTNEVYELNEEDEIIFLLENRSAEEQKAVIQVDDRTSEVITVMPAGKIQVESDGPGGANSAEKATDPTEGGPGVNGGGSGNGGGGGGSTPIPEVPEEPSSEAPTEESAEESTEAGSEETTAPEESDPSETTEAEEPTQPAEPADPTDSTDAPEESEDGTVPGESEDGTTPGEDGGSGDTTTDPSEDDNEGNTPDAGDGSDTGSTSDTDGGSASDTDTGSGTDEGTDTGSDSGSEEAADSSDTSTGGDTSSDSGSQSSDTSDSSDSEDSSDTSGEGAPMASISLREFRLVATAAGTETTEAAESTEAADTETEESKEEESKAEETLESEEETSEETTASDETTASEETTAPEETTAAEETTAPEETSEAGGDSEVVVEEPDSATSSEADKDDAEEATPSEATPSEADKNSIEGDIYEAVKVGDYAVVAFATTAGEVGLTELPPEIFAKELKDVTVEAVAERGVFPIGTTMDVMALGEDTAEYENAREALKAEGTESAGMLAYDISFKNMAGEEIEPVGEVNVSIRLSTDLLPEDADLDSLTVHHMAEEGSSTIKAEAVADVGTETAGTVEVVQEEAIAAFSVESFSTFTITWNGNGEKAKPAINVTSYIATTVGDDSQEASFEHPDLIVGAQNKIRFTSENEKLAVKNYRLIGAELRYYSDGWKETEVYEFWSYNNDWTWEEQGESWQYYYTTKKDGNEQSVTHSERRPVSIKLYYAPVSETEQPLRIQGDDIANSGSLKAVLQEGIISDPSQYFYKWYKDGVEVKGQIKDTIEVYMESNRPVYKVELWKLVGSGSEMVVASETYKLPYYNELINGSFEDPEIASTDPIVQYTNGVCSELVWKTTGPGIGDDEGLDIEIINAGVTNQALLNQLYGADITAAEGKQFAELNCEANGTLYQDVLTAPGLELWWSVSHRARTHMNQGNTYSDAEDTMCVVIMATKDAIGKVETQADVDEIVRLAGFDGKGTVGEVYKCAVPVTYKGVNAEVWRITSDARWRTYLNEQYKVPDGQYLTRFMFGAVESEFSKKDNYASIGNFLDDVSFGQDIRPEENKGTLRIKKSVEGMDDATVISAETYKFSIYNDGELVEEVKLPQSSARPSATSLWGKEILVSPGVYTVVEENPNATLNNFRYKETSYEIKDPDSKTGSNCQTSAFIVSTNEEVEVIFTNTYERSEGKLTISKTVTGDMGDTTKDFEFVLSLTKDNTPYNQPLSYIGYAGKDQPSSGNLDYNLTSKGYVFKLKDKTNIEITVPSGYLWEVKEVDTEYDTKVTLDDVMDDVSKKSVSGIVSDNRVVEFLNTKDMQAPTGITTEILPYGLMLAAGALGATGFKLKGRRKDDDD